MPGGPVHTIELKVGDNTMTETVNIVRDPRLTATDEDLAAQYQLKLSIRDEVSRVHAMVNQIRRLQKQLDGWTERIKASGGNDALSDDAAAAKKKLDELLDELIVVKPGMPKPGGARLKDKLNTLSTMIDESDDAPTAGALEVFESLGERVDERSNRLHRIIAGELAAFNTKVQQAGLAPVGD